MDKRTSKGGPLVTRGHGMQAITRRSFTTAAALGGAAGLASMMAAAKPVFAADADDIAWDGEADIVVAGCGAGGAPAVIEACAQGSSVIVIEKYDWLGGQMRRSGGGITASCTCVQKALGVEDSNDAFYDYMVACAEGLADEEQLRLFADRCGSDFDWVVQDLAGQTEADWKFTDGVNGQVLAMKPGLDLGGSGVWFDDYDMEPVPRCYWFSENPDDIDEDGTREYCPDGVYGRGDTDTGRGGTGLWKPFQDAIDASGAEVRFSTSLVSLVTNGAGEVIGIKAHDLVADVDVFLKAHKGVIIATGDYSRNEDMTFNFMGDGYVDQTTFPIIKALALEGETDGAGILAAQGVGAQIVKMFYGPAIGGLVTDLNSQVLDVFGEPIPRLFASSYAVSGRMGKNYPGCGLNNMWNITFGRIAADSASKLEPWD